MRLTSYILLALTIVGLTIFGAGCDSEKKSNPIGPGASGGFVVSDTLLKFGEDIATIPFTLVVSGGGDVQWNITSDQAWLRVSKTSGYTNDGDTTKINATVIRTTLLEGDYTGKLTITPEGGAAKTIRVTMAVKPAVLKVSVDTLNFGSNNALTSLKFDITNTGVGLLNWKLEIAEGAEWLSVSADSGEVATAKVGTITNKATVTVTADRAMDNGDYTGTLLLTSNGGEHSIHVDLRQANPIMVINTNTLAFAQGEDRKSITVANTGVATLVWTASAERGKDWLSVEEARGSIEPGRDSTIVVLVDRSGIATGNYSAKLTITPNAGVAKEITVTLEVVGPTLGLSTHNLDFGARETAKGLEIRNVGSGDLKWTATTSDAWLKVSRANGTTKSTVPTPLIITVDRTGLDYTNYKGYIFVSAPDVGGFDSVEVVMSVVPPEPAKMSIAPKSLAFGLDQSELSFTISNSGDLPLNWNASESLDWLTVTPLQGQTNYGAPASVKVRVSRMGMNQGQYSGYVRVTSNGGNDSVAVSIEVGQVVPPKLEVTPETLDFGTATNQLNFTITNAGGEPLEWTLTKVVDTGNWLNTSLNAGTTLKNNPTTVIASVTRAGLGDGNYSGMIILDGGIGGKDTVRVSMQVTGQSPPDTSIIWSFSPTTNQLLDGSFECKDINPGSGEDYWGVVEVNVGETPTKFLWCAARPDWPGGNLVYDNDMAALAILLDNRSINITQYTEVKFRFQMAWDIPAGDVVAFGIMLTNGTQFRVAASFNNTSGQQPLTIYNVEIPYDNIDPTNIDPTKIRPVFFFQSNSAGVGAGALITKFEIWGKKK